jgi:Xaa-Pro aminopeptidase
LSEDAGHRRSHTLNEQILSAIRRLLQARGLDAYIAYTPSNVLYTTGFQGYFLIHILPDGIERLHKQPHGLRVTP